jgi:hypothetical protein
MSLGAPSTRTPAPRTRAAFGETIPDQIDQPGQAATNSPPVRLLRAIAPRRAERRVMLATETRECDRPPSRTTRLRLGERVDARDPAADQRAYEIPACPRSANSRFSDVRVWLRGANDSATFIAE